MSTKSFRSGNNRQDLESIINSGSNKIKRKIRDIERLLAKKKDSLPDTILIEKERYLKTLNLELKHNELKQKAQKYSKKYHMIRFFEKKKSLKNYKKALKAGKEDIKKEQLELLYAYNFPKCEKYVSLYPSSEEKEAAVPKDRQFYLAAIEKHWKNKTLPLSVSDIMNGKKNNQDDIGLLIKEEIPEDLEEVKESEVKKAEIVEDNENSDEDDFFE
ncbi:hypothetical protein FOG51_03945 [Hanseniaspora uvarum]|mgnify:FL=1|nr:hypothetical protein FOG48_01991 [Hanseniaspora uvarum]KAF0271067.1 hypothetical protein FOG51_03945 [Hanseniaspora uvarum]KAF0275044.1 hypothetical protein FOG50_04089 [Hanseniaspora uvarum]KKA02598.1 hypothetical protein D499_0H00900 [Hanseniaspora uvarum DSM 2768]GMM39913.1 Efg1 protein [Hanseniaspora uvarum]